MPHSTQNFGFEWKVLKFASELSQRLQGERAPASFIMELNHKGAVRLLRFDISGDQLTALRSEAA